VKQDELEKLLNRFKEKYKDKYTYFPETILGMSKLMKIKCDCGEVYYKSPYDHLRYGCKKCGAATSKAKRTMSQEDFERRIKEVHGDKFDLSKSIFINAMTKLPVICLEHGEFLAMPSELFRGVGCPWCGGSKKYTQEEYIKEILKVHGNKFDISKVIYTGSNNYVTVICYEHGEFIIRASNFIKDRGCPKCGRLIAIEKTKKDFEYYLQEFQKKHGNKYDYSKFIFRGSEVKGIIICTIHGEFEQTPVAHLNYGCKKCSIEARAKSLMKTEEEKFEYFITKARKVHGNKFEYFPDEPLTEDLKRKIKCVSKGHVFYQDQSSHLRGIGCPYCNESKGENAVCGILDKYNIKYTREYKIPEVKETYNKNYEYDFFLPEYNILIEYHGIQHYQHIIFFGDVNEFEKTKRRDFAKETLAKAFRKKLIIIPYTVFERNKLEEYLVRKLFYKGVPKELFNQD
jgi:predicted  nucleic acid-binding Zn-ribbon protein